MPGSSGKRDDLADLCECGHARRDHHMSWFAMTGARIVEECEHAECIALPWFEQCNHFRLKEATL